MSPEERARAVLAGWTNIPRWRRDVMAEDITAAIRAAVAEERARCLAACEAEGRVYASSQTWVEACASCARSISREEPT